jgi:hypothetical protein
MKRLLQVTTALLMLACAGIAQAQASLDLPPGYWEKVRADKKAWVAQNMNLTPDEEKRFWPVYDGYQKELRLLDRRLLEMLETYAKHYRAQSLTDDMAEKLTAETLAIEEGEVRLRKIYANKLSKILPGRKAARYLQLESRMRTVIRFELAKNFPLVGDTPEARATAPKK